MKNLKQIIEEAREKKVAIGHFNISNLDGLWAVFNAANNLTVPVIIGVSEGERDFMGVKQVASLVKSLREEFNYPIYLNADHSYSKERVLEAVRAGFDAVIFDGASLPIEENIRITKECVVEAKAINPDVLVEGELGYIGKSSKVLDEIPAGVGLDENSLTHPDDAKRFVEETGVDLFAPSVGNIHGMIKGIGNPALNIKVLEAIAKSTGVPLVLHGGSGISDSDFTASIQAGINVIHINTEIRLAYKKGLMSSLQENPDEIAPYKYLRGAMLEMQKMTEKRLKLFNNFN